jgi:hypothetical protein
MSQVHRGPVTYGLSPGKFIQNSNVSEMTGKPHLHNTLEAEHGHSQGPD